jgi:aquaporin Z
MSINKLAAELLGTHVLVLGGAAAIVSAAAGGAPSNIAIVASAFGLALIAGLYAFGEVSGGHYNPAVSFATELDGRMDPLSMAGCWIAQVVGATLGWGICRLVTPGEDA